MKKPEKKSLGGTYKRSDYTIGVDLASDVYYRNQGYNQAIDDYEKYLEEGTFNIEEWVKKNNYVNRNSLPSEKEIHNMLMGVVVNYKQPIGAKGQPTPKKMPLYLWHWKVSSTEVKALAKAISKRLRGE